MGVTRSRGVTVARRSLRSQTELGAPRRHVARPLRHTIDMRRSGLRVNVGLDAQSVGTHHSDEMHITLDACGLHRLIRLSVRFKYNDAMWQCDVLQSQVFRLPGLPSRHGSSWINLSTPPNLASETQKGSCCIACIHKHRDGRYLRASFDTLPRTSAQGMSHSRHCVSSTACQ